MAFNRRRKKQDDAAQVEGKRIAREAAELLDPFAERTMVLTDDGERAFVQPGQVLENIHHRMERVDLDPDTEWAPQDLMSMEETEAVFNQLHMGETVVTETAWYARQVLARWPADLVEHPINPEARIEMFLKGPQVEPEDGDVARRVLNRALASPERVDTHPELADLDDKELVGIWLALVFWFGIKSGLLHQMPSDQ